MSVQFTRTERDYSQQTKNVKIAINKSLLKEFNNNYERVVYLENGDEFQIQIFNDQTTDIGAKIYINGELIGNSYLVVRPGERVWLDRYLDKAKKFKFSTYEVNGNNEQVKKAIAKNGVVKVELYKKKEPVIWKSPIIYEPSPIIYEPHVYYTSTEPYSTCLCDCVCDVTGVSTTGAVNNYCNSITTGDSALSFSASGSASSASTCTSSSAVYEGAGLKSLNKTRGISAQANSKKVETGRIQEGSYSDQEFDYVDMQFEYWAYDTETIHILPKSTKPTYADDLQKIYCHNCGRKLKTKFNYCPFCGAKL